MKLFDKFIDVVKNYAEAYDQLEKVQREEYQ
jgi:hypothetical protein